MVACRFVSCRSSTGCTGGRCVRRSPPRTGARSSQCSATCCVVSSPPRSADAVRARAPVRPLRTDPRPGTDLSVYPPEHLLAAEAELTNRPRLVLNDETRPTCAPRCWPQQPTSCLRRRLEPKPQEVAPVSAPFDRVERTGAALARNCEAVVGDTYFGRRLP